jgi:ssRNA-specific RNase YbeY (16S rRNA maturation enzyme)
MLHLAGYDDIEDDDRAKMRQAEARVMTKLEEDGVTTTGFLKFI